MDKELIALKMLALLHDPPVKPLVFIMDDRDRSRLSRALGLESQGRNFHERIAEYIVERIISIIKSRKEELAIRLQEIMEQQDRVKEADIAASSIDRTILNALYGEVVDRILFKPVSYTHLTLPTTERV